MNFNMALSRARRALRDDLKLYLVAVSSLTVAFLCLAAALLAIGNLSHLADHLREGRRMTVYLVDGAERGEIAELRVLLTGLAEVQGVEVVTSEQARAMFLENTDLSGDLGELNAEVFPSSLELTLTPGADGARVEEMGSRIATLAAVDEVETYGTWFSQLESLLATGNGLAAGLALLVVICVLAVVGNTIRLSVANRREEVEVMKLCGATDSFVRGPFLVEGIAQGLCAAALSIVLLFGAFLAIRGQLDASLAALSGLDSRFLTPSVVFLVVLGGALAGAVGSALSLRRYLSV